MDVVIASAQCEDDCSIIFNWMNVEPFVQQVISDPNPLATVCPFALPALLTVETFKTALLNDLLDWEPVAATQPIGTSVLAGNQRQFFSAITTALRPVVYGCCWFSRWSGAYSRGAVHELFRVWYCPEPSCKGSRCSALDVIRVWSRFLWNSFAKLERACCLLVLKAVRTLPKASIRIFRRTRLQYGLRRFSEPAEIRTFSWT